MAKTNKIEWVTRKHPDLPDFTTPAQVDAWKKQRDALGAHPEFKNWVYLVEWPDYIDPPEPPKGGSEMASWNENAVLRDAPHPVKVDLPTLWVKRENLLDVIKFLKDDDGFQYGFLADLTAVDFLNSPDPDDNVKNQGKRFQTIYIVRCFGMNPTPLQQLGLRVRIVVPVDETEAVPSLTGIWVGANWPEREVYDLMGIEFEGHPDLRRILMPDNYRGYPLRKDFPLQGPGEDYLIQDLLDENLVPPGEE